MKLAAFDHPKTLALKSLLKCSYPAVIGHLELFWKFTAQHAPRGNVGKWPDSAIAAACGWEGEAAAFTAALVQSGYIEESVLHRLLVHDWKEHCPQWVRAQLAKANLLFASSEATEEASSVRPSEPSTIPSQAKPSQAKPDRERATALSPNFGLTDAQVAYARGKGILDVPRELEAFKAHHLAHGKVMKDWSAAWRTWCLNFEKFGGKSNGKESRKLSAREIVERATAERAAVRAKQA